MLYEVITIPFKHVNGSIIQNYAINKDMTFNHMFEELKKKICYDFEFENFEIVPDSGLRERGLELIQSLSRFSNINDLFVYNIINDDSRFYVRPIGTGSDTISSVIDCVITSYSIHYTKLYEGQLLKPSSLWQSITLEIVSLPSYNFV